MNHILEKIINLEKQMERIVSENSFLKHCLNAIYRFNYERHKKSEH